MRLPHMRRPARLLVPGLALVLALSVPATVQIVRGAGTIPPAKQALLDRIHHLRLAGQNAPQPPKHPHYAPPATMPAAWPSGIFQTGLAPFPAGLYSIENQWQETVGGQHIQVYAGAQGANPAQGVVVVETTSLDLHTVHDVTYQTPAQDGSLHIVAATGALLTLTSAQGRAFIFDAAAQTLAPQ